MPQQEADTPRPISSMIRRRKIDDSLETKLVTGLIVSTRFIRGILPMLDVQCFRVPFAKRVVKWSLDYYQRYQEAPGNHIEDIFETEKRNLEQTEVAIIQEYLATLSEQYEESRFNPAFWLDKAEGFFREQSLRLIKNNMDALLGAGRVADAEAQITNYKKVIKVTSGWVDPFDPDYVATAMKQQEEGRLFRLPGTVGEFIGWFCEGHLISYEGPLKRGKSWYLGESFLCSVLEKIPSVFIGLGDMETHEYAVRIFKRVTGTWDKGGVLRYPAMDCLSNQDGTCVYPQRTNRAGTALVNEHGNKPKWSYTNTYRVCTACRGSSRFTMGTWYEALRREKLTVARGEAAMRGFNIQVGKRLGKINSFPSDSINVSDIKDVLDALEFSEDFVPRVIVLDYADLLSAERSDLLGTEREDATWKALKNLAQTRHACVITAVQTGRQGLKKRNVSVADQAGYIGKSRHANKIITLNQTDKEKREGLMRIGIGAGRDSFFVENEHVMVFQQLDVGQPILDSIRVGYSREQEEEGD